MGFALQPPRQRGTREIGERTSGRAMDEGDGKPWSVLAGRGGVCAVWPPLHGTTALIGLHLSPAGGKPHGRGEGGGEGTGEATMDPGDARLRRKRQGCAPGTCSGDVPRLPATR